MDTVNNNPVVSQNDTLPRQPIFERVADINAVIFARWRLRNATTLGDRARVYGRVWVRNWGQLIIGKNLYISAQMATVELTTFLDGKLTIGHHVYINRGTSIVSVKQITIGNHCHIGAEVSIMDNGFHRLDPDRRNEMPDSQPVIIEDNVWLGNRVMVMPGVTIGAGAAVGAGSIVTKDVPSRSLAVGVPAKVVRRL